MTVSFVNRSYTFVNRSYTCELLSVRVALIPAQLGCETMHMCVAFDKFCFFIFGSLITRVTNCALIFAILLHTGLAQGRLHHQAQLHFKRRGAKLDLENGLVDSDFLNRIMLSLTTTPV